MLNPVNFAVPQIRKALAHRILKSVSLQCGLDIRSDYWCQDLSF